jgi:5-(aminomethyl)-3-furanmethanol phosphate kinase
VTAQALPVNSSEREVVSSPRPIVVKLGGSVVRSPELPAWLDAIAGAPRAMVIVPGGGALADEVRSAQAALGFGDGAAHRMALLAMDQLAWAVAGLCAGFEVGDTEAALRRALERGRVAVWAPYALVANRSDVPASWSVTSDSLALWLARRLEAERVFVIKAMARPRHARSAAELAREGVVDAAFPAMLSEAGVPAILLGRGDQAAFAASLAAPGEPACGTTID